MKRLLLLIAALTFQPLATQAQTLKKPAVPRLIEPEVRQNSDLERLPVFAGALVTKRFVSNILAAEGFEYVDHASCADSDDCLTFQPRVATGSGRDASPYLLVVGTRPGTGTVGYLIVDAPCEMPGISKNSKNEALGALQVARKGGAAKQAIETTLDTKRMSADPADFRGCLGNYYAPYRMIYDHAFRIDSDSRWHRFGYHVQRFYAAKWRNTYYYETYEETTGLAVRSDGFDNSGYSWIANRQGETLHYESWSGTTMPGSSDTNSTSEVSVTEACTAYAAANAGNAPRTTTMLQYTCEVFEFSGQFKIGPDDGPAQITVNIPDFCGASEKATEKIVQQNQKELYLQCLQKPSIAGVPGVGGGSSVVDSSDLDMAEYEDSEEIENNSREEDTEENLCTEGTVRQEIVITKDGKQCKSVIERTCDKDCNCSEDIVEEEVCS